MVAPLPPLTLLQVLPFADCCHWIFPECPLRLNVVVPPLTTKAEAAEAVPPTDAAPTVIPPETALVVLQSLVLVITQ